MRKKFAAIICAVLLVLTASMSVRAEGTSVTTYDGVYTIEGLDGSAPTSADYRYDGTLTITSNKKMKISGTGTTTANVIRVQNKSGENSGANITLSNINIKNTNTAAFDIDSTHKGDVTLTLDGVNTLETTYNGSAGLQKTNSTCNLTINGSGSLTAIGGTNGAGIGGGNTVQNKNCNNITIESGTIIATGGNYAAGIGGGKGGNGTNIKITGGTVTATGYCGGAGIGGGSGSGNGTDGKGTDIIITGGTVIAKGSCKSVPNNNPAALDTGSNGGAGIGGGDKGKGDGITITGSANVTATGNGGGAGIGGGSFGNGENITIGKNENIEELKNVEFTGKVTANGGTPSKIKVTIGMIGYSKLEKEVEIAAYAGGYSGAGIGGGYRSDGKNITITGSGTITATGGSDNQTSSAGIGGGGGGISTQTGVDTSGGEGENITINLSSGGQVIAKGGNGEGSYDTNTGQPSLFLGGAGIGGGGSGKGGGSGNTIKIGGEGTVTATGGSGCGAGIGGGGSYGGLDAGNGTGIEITGGEVIATGSGNGSAGIGGGGGGMTNNNKSSTNGIGEVTITGGTVTANGTVGIGGGSFNSGRYNDGTENGKGSTVNISGECTVKANGTTGINGSDITIGGGEVTATATEFAGINGNNVEISGGKIEATGGYISAGIAVSGTIITGIDEAGKMEYDNEKKPNILDTVTGELKISGGEVTAKGGNNGGAGIDSNNTTIEIWTNESPPQKIIFGTVSNDATISGGNVTATGKTGITGSDITLSGGKITATGTDGAGIDGTDVYIGKDKGENENDDGTTHYTTDTDYPWVVTNKIDSGTDHSGDYHGVVFDKNHKTTYEPSEHYGKEYPAYAADGVVYGGTVELTEDYTIGKGVLLRVESGATLVTNGHLTIADGGTLYLETGATLNTYDDIENYKDPTDYPKIPNDAGKRKILHEDPHPDTDGTICTICGSEVPHHWSDEWEQTPTHHWHECVAEDCSVFINPGLECSIKDDKEKDGYGEHRFGEPVPDEEDSTKSYLICKDCLYKKPAVAKVEIQPIQLIKKDDKNKGLEGAVFGLYSDSTCTDTNKVGSGTSSATDGKVSFVADEDKEIEPNKTYYIKEITPPAGYMVSKQVFKAVINDDGTVTYSGEDGEDIKFDETNHIPICVNTPITIQIKKVYVKNGKNIGLPGAEFGLSEKVGTNNYTKIGSGTSGTDGTVSFTLDGDNKIKRNTEYQIKETKAPTGYQLSTEVITVNVNQDGKVTYGTNSSTEIPVCVNNKSITPDPIQIIKVDGETNKPLAGATFGLYSNVGCTDKVGGGTSKADGTVSFTADADKKIEPSTTYYIKEITAPSGYTASTDVFTADVGEDGTVTYNGNSTPPTCVNTKNTSDPVTCGPIQVMKVDGETNGPLAGATFGLYSNAGCTDKIGGGTSEADGMVSFTADAGKEIEPGTTYYIKEITAPSGYTASTDVFTADVGEDGTVTYGAAKSTDIPVCINSKIVITCDPIQVMKVDGETNEPLAGAQFGLYSDQGCTDKIGGGTSEADGMVSFTADAGKEIEPGTTYYIKEITAPSGYTASTDVFTADVNADGTVTYGAAKSTDIPVCVNSKIVITCGPIQVMKVDGETHNPLAGAQFGLYSDQGCTGKIGGGASGANGMVSFTADAGREIEPGTTYYIKEITAPSGYTASEEVFKAVVGADGKVTYGDKGSEDIPVCKNEKSTSPDKPPTTEEQPTTAEQPTTTERPTTAEQPTTSERPTTSETTAKTDEPHTGGTSSTTGVYKTGDNSQAPLCIIVLIIAVLGFSTIKIAEHFAKDKC